MSQIFEDLTLLPDIYQFNNSTISIYENELCAELFGLMENDVEYVQEGVMDMLHDIGEAIRKLMKAIKSFFLNFIRAIKSYHMGLDEFVKEYKSELLKVDVNFKYTGYQFNVMNSKDPDMSDFQNLVSSYNNIVSDFSKISLDEVKKQNAQWLSDEKLNEIRGRVLGTNKPIIKDDFVETVKKFYRGSMEPEPFTVTSSYIKDAVDRAGKLMEMMKKSSTDRDKILNLLSKAELFFDRKVTLIYKSNQKKLSAKSLEYNGSDLTLKSTDAGIDYSDDNMIKFNKIVTFKYNETRVLSSIINVVISERANAFKDLVKQDNQILRKALNPKYNKEDSVGEATDYTNLLEEANLILQDDQIKVCFEQINAEYNAVIACLETGFYDEAVMEGVIRDVVDKVAGLLQNFLQIFRKKAVENVEKYEGWYNEDGIEDIIIENAKSQEFTLYPHWKGNPNKDLVKVGTLLSAVVNKPKDINSAAYANDFITAENVQALKEISASDRTLMLKNYFRSGQKNKVNVPHETLKGSALKSKIPTMFSYVKNFDTLSKSVSQLQNKIKNYTNVGLESTDQNILSILGGHTVLESCNWVMEKDNNPLAANSASVSQKTINSTGNTPANASVSNAKKQAESATKVVNNADEKIKDNQTIQIGNPSQKDLEGYYKVSLKFAQDVTTAFMTSVEERYFSYMKVLQDCAGPEYSAKFDDDGKYAGTKKNPLKKAKDSIEDSVKRNKAAKTLAKRDQSVQDNYNPIENKPTKGMSLFW